MQCKIKKVTKYTVEGFDITINVSPEELKQLQDALGIALSGATGPMPEVDTILNSINKELDKI